MIYQTYKNLLAQKSQTGISLLLAVLILTAITSISFSMAAIVFVEIKSSGDLLRTEPAFYATLGVTEEALFQYKRYVNERQDGTTTNTLDVPNCQPSSNAICSLAGVTLTLPGSQPLDFDVSPSTVTVYAGELVTVPLYQLNNFDLLYNDIVIKLIPNGISATDGLEVYLDVTAQDDSNPSDISIDPNFTLSDEIDVANFMVTGNQYDLVFDNSSGTKNFFVNIDSVGNSNSPLGNNNPLGLPYVNKKALRVVANYLGLTRTYLVEIPVP
ncbi:MAG: hypothetical protein R3B41_03960 [Candidatus Doudnabacteria bacterium]